MAKKKKDTKKNKRGGTIKLVVKSNELVEARYMFDIWETRFFHSLIANIHKNDEDDKVYRLWFKDMKNNFRLKSNQSYDYLREAAISMAGKSVYIGWQNDKFRRGRMHRIIRFVDYLEKGQEGEGIGQQEYIDVSIDKDIRPYLLDIKKNFNPEISRYTSYDLRNIIKLKPYAVRIYELLKQMEFKGFRTIHVEDLKDMFEIKDQYPRFSNFYQKVILSSITTINKYTDLTIPEESIEKLKRGRKIYALRFLIISKTRAEVQLIRGGAEQRTLFGDIEEIEVLEEQKHTVETLFAEFEAIVVAKFGVTAGRFRKLLKSGKVKRENIIQAIAVTRRAKYRQEIKKNIAGFFISALQYKYTDAEEEAKRAKVRKAEKAREIAELEAKIMAKKDEFSLKINERIRQITAEDEQITARAIAAIEENPLTEALLKVKEKELGRKLEVDDYRNDERLRIMVIMNIQEQQKARFEDILEAYHPGLNALAGELEKLRGRVG